ncbi:MAG: precorrin-6A reductase [Gloeomargarita sp. SKYBB_i_bin120]|nr:precorrin-6A reductase [Gloeomargarita sp. SKYG98]MCS7292022.1 precorrin-6A reductase [Gloeomargarita sp. SKYB120]MDW8177582.1 precorrin-6A reductase [Gloeomargarita sp. SKYBB_i_bin120]
MTLWLIGGTCESAELAAQLGADMLCVITVTTERAKRLYGNLTVLVTHLTPENIHGFVRDYQITRILDMSHPHAAQISQLAIACAAQYHLPYLRYERPPVPDSSSHCFYWRDLDELFSRYSFGRERILVTLGYRQLPRLKPYWGEHSWFVRILPDPVALTTALEVGFLPQHIIALWPPVSYELERALWQQWGITQVIAKASGAPGGEAVKHQVAQELGVVLHLLQRPAVSYPQQTDDLAVALAFARGETTPG